MTHYTKNQIESGTLSAKELLESWTSGQGATGKDPKKFSHVKTGAINNIPVSVDLMTALLEKELARQKPSQSFYDAIKAGYLSINHLDEYKDSTAKKEPLEGHYLTSSEWLQSCIDMLPELATPSFNDILSLMDDYKPSMNKTELQAIIEQVISLCTVKQYSIADITEEQRAKYYDLLGKEKAIEDASNALRVYLEDIKPVKGNDIALQGRFFPENGQGAELVKLIDQEGWSILHSTPVPAKLDSNFVAIEKAYVLMSIQLKKAGA